MYGVQQLTISFTWQIFYIVAAVLSTVLTSTVRTSGGRLPLLLILSVNFCVERYICSHLSAERGRDSHEARDDMHWWSWWSRRVTVLVCAAVLAAVACVYRDLAVVNNTLLTEIHKQNGVISRALEQRANGAVSRAATPDCELIYPRVHTTKYNLRSRLTPVRNSNKQTESEDLSASRA